MKVMIRKLKPIALIGGLLFSGQLMAKIEVSLWYSGGSKPQQVMKELVAEFNASQDTYVVKAFLQGSYGETYQKLQAGLASNTAPEVALLQVTQAKALKNKGISRDLNEYIDASFNFDDFIPAFREQVTANDWSVIGLPAYGTTQVLYYNKQKLADAGFTQKDLSTWQGLAKVAAAVTERNNKGTVRYYGWEPIWGYSNMLDAVLSNNGKVISDDGKTVLIDSDEWVEVWESFRQWIHDDQIMRIHYGGQGWQYWYSTIDDVMKNRALGYTGSSGDQGDLDFTRLAATAQPGWGDNQAAPQAGALVFAMPKGTDDKAAEGAFAFIKYYTNAENTARWSMRTGYIPVRHSVSSVPEYAAYIISHPQAFVTLQQTFTASQDFVDPTNGKIIDALKVAADQVQIQNVPAKKALQQAARKAQRALDRANRSKD